MAKIDEIGTQSLYKTCFGHKLTQRAPNSIILNWICSILPLDYGANVQKRFKGFSLESLRATFDS